MLTADDALRAYAAMVNTGDVDRLAPLLSPEFHYESQTVFDSLDREGFLEYIRGKLAAIRRSGSGLHAEMGIVRAYQGEQPCVVLAQPTRSDVRALILATVEAGRLLRLDLCVVPPPESAIRTGEYPK